MDVQGTVFREERCQVQQRQPQSQYALKPSLIKLDQSHLLLKTFLRESCGAFLTEAVRKGRKVFQIVVDSKQDKGVDASTLIPVVHKLALGRCCCCYYFCLPYNNFSRRKSHERLSWTRSLPDSLLFSFSSPLLRWQPQLVEHSPIAYKTVTIWTH